MPTQVPHILLLTNHGAINQPAVKCFPPLDSIHGCCCPCRGNSTHLVPLHSAQKNLDCVLHRVGRGGAETLQTTNTCVDLVQVTISHDGTVPPPPHPFPSLFIAAKRCPPGSPVENKSTAARQGSITAANKRHNTSVLPRLEVPTGAMTLGVVSARSPIPARGTKSQCTTLGHNVVAPSKNRGGGGNIGSGSGTGL